MSEGKKIAAVGCACVALSLAINAIVIAGGVWLVVTVLRWMGVL